MLLDQPQYAGATAPPINEFMAAAGVVCQVLNLDPFGLIPRGEYGAVITRRDAIAADCALVWLLMQALTLNGMAPRTHD